MVVEETMAGQEAQGSRFIKPFTAKGETAHVYKGIS